MRELERGTKRLRWKKVGESKEGERSTESKIMRTLELITKTKENLNLQSKHKSKGQHCEVTMTNAPKPAATFASLDIRYRGKLGESRPSPRLWRSKLKLDLPRTRS